MSRILLLEDDLSLIDGLSFVFKKQGFDADIARTIKEADALWADGRYDLLLLDVSLPDGSGFGFCQKVRRTSNVPIIFLTASDEETSTIMGLDIGGDDYITKPFKLGILISRINALLRRAASFSAKDTGLRSNGIQVLLLQGQVFKNGTQLDLTAAEYKLLCLFMRNPNMVLTKEQILEELWDRAGNYIDNSALTVYMRRLRMKIEDDPSAPQMLLTVRGMGYKWKSSIEVRHEDTGEQGDQKPIPFALTDLGGHVFPGRGCPLAGLPADFSLSPSPFPAGRWCRVGRLPWIFQTARSDHGAGGVADRCVS